MAQDRPSQHDLFFLRHVVVRLSGAAPGGPGGVLLEVAAACRQAAHWAIERVEGMERSDRLDRFRQQRLLGEG